mgnify:FL=1
MLFAFLHLIQIQEYCSMLLTTGDSVGSTVLIIPIVLHAYNFWLCTKRLNCLRHHGILETVYRVDG